MLRQQCGAKISFIIFSQVNKRVSDKVQEKEIRINLFLSKLPRFTKKHEF